MIIYIIGITGVGKSIIGKALARKLSINFIDLDALIQVRERKNISELFEISQDYFRNCETNALKSIPLNEDHIVSTGGGIVLRDENIEHMKKTGYVVQIHRAIENIYKTLNPKRRPLLRKDKHKLFSLYEDRKEKYEKARDFLVDCTNKKTALKNLYIGVKEYEKREKESKRQECI